MHRGFADFPDGRRVEEPAKEDTADTENDEAFAECIGADYSGFTMIGDAEPDDFAMGETAVVSSDAQVFESERWLRRRLRSSPKA
jgi:hypothetical protein